MRAGAPHFHRGNHFSPDGIRWMADGRCRPRMGSQAVWIGWTCGENGMKRLAGNGMEQGNLIPSWREQNANAARLEIPEEDRRACGLRKTIGPASLWRGSWSFDGFRQGGLLLFLAFAVDRLPRVGAVTPKHRQRNHGAEFEPPFPSLQEPSLRLCREVRTGEIAAPNQANKAVRLPLPRQQGRPDCKNGAALMQGRLRNQRFVCGQTVIFSPGPWRLQQGRHLLLLRREPVRQVRQPVLQKRAFQPREQC